MKLQSTLVKAACGALVLATLSFSAARADDPSPAAVASARIIIASSGMQRSFDLVVPQMLAQLETNVIRTRPEIKDKLHATLLQLQPEFLKSEDQVTNAAAVSLAKRMSEADLKDTAAFFQSAAGKKYVEAQPQALSDIVAALQGWQQKLSTDIMTRVRDEMKKQGIEL